MVDAREVSARAAIHAGSNQGGGLPLMAKSIAAAARRYVGARYFTALELVGENDFWAKNPTILSFSEQNKNILFFHFLCNTCGGKQFFSIFGKFPLEDDRPDQ